MLISYLESIWLQKVLFCSGKDICYDQKTTNYW